MTEDVRTRRLENRLTEVLGEEEAMTLLERLPRGQPATKADLDALEHGLGDRVRGVERRLDGLEVRMDGLDVRMDGLDVRMEGLEARIVDFRERLEERIDQRIEASEHRVIGALHQGMGQLRTEFATQTRTYIVAMLGMFVTLAGLAFAALRIT